MSNYNIQVPWSGKDSLNDTDPDKVVSGGDFNTEFSAVKIAVNSKADLAGSSSQAFFATTLGTTANPTTQVATTQYVATAVAAGVLTPAAINAIVYPVGSIYFNATSAENPAHATLLGFGTWAVYAAGKVAVGLDADDADFNALTDTGGSKTHTLSIAEIPSHTHDLLGGGFDAANGAEGGNSRSSNFGAMGSTGGGGAHNNLQPYVVVRMWKRTA